MPLSSPPAHTLGWVGTGRMGFPMAGRLAKAGGALAVYNRTRAKAEPLTEYGATIVGRPADLADRDVVFTMVSTSDDLLDVTLGQHGVLSRDGRTPKVLIDCSTVSEEASAKLRAAAAERGTQMLAAPVSGNGKVVKAGKLSLVVSGPKEAYDMALPWLEALGTGVSYVGEGDLARIIKICHNVFLGIVIQSLAELTVLAEKTGVPRHAFLDFINKSVMGSVFTRYKTPALVKLDFTPTFTPVLLRKDMDLGLAAARSQNVPMPVAVAAREAIQALIGNGYLDEDFARLITLQARNSGLDLKPENVAVEDGLSGR
ncbi:NAD(P)-dependent oxidoreductase [Reyranella sp. CPCC 100927]|uniref:NAD(P)-dependent oxidoreductase n=1 Tax=Reyranella sp. CPCC 100927 TaxID=2599616 RepID=UPI0011B3CAA5|nr:NAD(P)-dependent oxidoreductase [Reyranella sp. CPCC 100927]TWT15322.1 NAD(P)-dependent oxidoreductase [Reyranella sp. CPCC 100927]